MAQRTGIPTLMDVAKEMCRLLLKFDLVIRSFTNNDPAVIAALEAAQAACAVLRQELAEYRVYGD